MPQEKRSILDIVQTRPLPRVRLAAGEKLFLRGEAADHMYAVAEGAVEVLMYGRVMERVGPGGIVGEMAVLDGDARCAAALTETPTELISIDRAAFLDLVAAEPGFALAVLRIMSARLRRANERRREQGM